MQTASRVSRSLVHRPGWGWAALGVLAMACGANARAQTPAAAPIAIELNKLEPLPAAAGASGAGCRVYVVVNNPDPDPITRLRLDLVLFGTDGVIARRLALDLAPLPAHKTAVRLFDLQGQPCEGISRMLVNDVLGCEFAKHEAAAADEAPQACMDRLQLSSRAKAELTK